MPGNFHSIPESVIASWPKPNYVDPVRREWLPAFAYAFLGVSTALVTGRFYLRVRGYAGHLGLDDLLVLIGWFFSVGTTTTACLGTMWYGLDRHTWDVELNLFSGAALMGFVAQIVFLVSTCATKCSILLFYRRMVQDTYSRRWLYAIWTALGLTGGYFLGTLLAYCMICKPLDAYWLSYNLDYTGSYTCLNGNILSPLVGTLSVISDLYSVILPFLMLRPYDLDVPRRQKIGLTIIFGLGLLVAGAGIGRTYYLWKINHTYDTSWTGFNLFICSLVECHLAVIGACAPSLRVFLRRYLSEPLKRTFGSSSRARKDPGSKTSDLSSAKHVSQLDRKWPADSMKGTSQTDERALAQPSVDGLRKPAIYEDVELAATRSLDWVPQIKSPEDYEAYALKNLSKHAFKKSDTTSTTNYYYTDPTTQHNLHNAV